ncbi:hypothetical protein QBZ16_003768 [Prototheca wickerhamii]|uniref:Autophagy-related protein 13 N-terminal domain-containing protein n=1 Tax=Prototheca wickerhamii TaxID=3111 RepID=A0AAD9IJQ9_PROWI|nr:hypothetical protein QBZ16_003768 [Prototheca wickerhamii]
MKIYLRSWGQDEQRLGRLAGTTERVETLLERWTFHHHQVLPDSPSTLSTSALARLSPGAIYKRLVILLRSVFTLLRTLPAHRLCRAGARERRVGFTVGYRLHSSLPPAAAPVADAAASQMLRLALAPSETPYGRLRVAVEYRAASAVRILEQTGTGAAPQIIFDYVGHEAREPRSRWDEGRGFSRSAPRVAFAEEATAARGGGSGGFQEGLMSKSLSGSVAAAGGRGKGSLLPVGSAPVGSSAAYVRAMTAERAGQAAAGRVAALAVAARGLELGGGGSDINGHAAERRRTRTAPPPPPRSPFQTTAVPAQASAEAGSLEERPGMSSPVRIPGSDQRYGPPAEALGSRRSSDARGASPGPIAQPAERDVPSTAAAGGVVARVVEAGPLARPRPGRAATRRWAAGPPRTRTRSSS